MRVTIIKRPPGLGFVASDHAILELEHEVTEVWYPDRPTWAFVRNCWRAAGNSDVAYTFFASEHALVAGAIFKLRRRRLVVAVGGYDTADDRVHGYGLAANGRGWVATIVGRLADALIPHSAFAEDELLRRQPRLRPKTETAGLAVDPARWPDPAVERDARLALTVATVSRASFSRKGIDRFLDAARADPGRPYVLAGRVLAEAEALVADHPPNVTLTGPTPPEELNELYWSAGIYVQLSWHETFAMAVAEAMVCGCVPVIARQPALLDVAGSWAVVTDGVAGDTDAIRKAEDPRIDRDAIRADVASRYAVDLRRAALNRALADRSGERHGHRRRRWASRGNDDLRRDHGDGDQRGDAERNERSPRGQ